MSRTYYENMTSHLKEFFYVITGSFIGSSLRYFIYRYGNLSFLNHGLSSTLFVNALGSFVFGLCLTQIKSSAPFGLFLAVGIIGSFTTFSTFSFESVTLLLEGKIGYFAFNILMNLSLSFLSFYIGFLINQKYFSF